jgi:hypothetical protein
MQISIIQNGRILRTICHEGQTYVETPTKGTYKLRVYNNSHRRRLAVISVDGVDICSGKDASYEGGGYCLSAWQTIEIPGFHRDNGTVAAFQFKEQGGSYAAQTGRGTKNVGVIGLAVFDEKVVRRVDPPPVHVHEHHHHTHTYGNIFNSPLRERGVRIGETWTGDCEENSLGSVTCSVDGGATKGAGTTQYSSDNLNMMDYAPERGGLESAMPIPACGAAAAEECDDDSFGADYEPDPVEKGLMGRLAEYQEEKAAGNIRGGRRRVTMKSATKDVGTGYGRKTHFATTEVKFTKATEQPVLVISVRYATRSRLVSWGVPVDKPNTGPQAANPFPAESQGVPAPPGWRG